VSFAFLLIHCRNQKDTSNSPSIETNSARTVCSNSPKHQPMLSKGQPGTGQAQHMLDHPLLARRDSPFGGHHQSPHHHHYSPIHSNINSQHQGYSPAPSAFHVAGHPHSHPFPATHTNTHHSELIQSSNQHHALLPASDKTNRSSSVSPAFCAQSVGTTRSNVQYHQYYHIPQRTSYGYLC
jgi:hypothetical protein